MTTIINIFLSVVLIATNIVYPLIIRSYRNRWEHVAHQLSCTRDELFFAREKPISYKDDNMHVEVNRSWWSFTPGYKYNPLMLSIKKFGPIRRETVNGVLNEHRDVIVAEYNTSWPEIAEAVEAYKKSKDDAAQEDVQKNLTNKTK